MFLRLLVLLGLLSFPNVHVGVASWYGPGFHGRRTASGERFNRHAYTLASRHLPMGSRVIIVNLRNGRSVPARVNDRGPYIKGRIADLSERVAREIGITGLGHVAIVSVHQPCVR